jgi:hypothetical protein
LHGAALPRHGYAGRHAGARPYAHSDAWPDADRNGYAEAGLDAYAYAYAYADA